MSGARPRATNWRTRHIDLPLGRRLQQLRSERGLSRADLARALRVSQPSIQHIEEGDNRVSAAQLWQICGVLGIEANVVFEALPNRIWRDRAEFEAFADPPIPAGVREEAAAFEPAPTARDVLKLAKAARGLSSEQIGLLIAAARGLRG